jgi:putative ABC transport system permease protein
VVKTLALKRRRDISRQKWQFIAVLVTVVIGVSMFAGTFNAYLNLGASLDGTYDRLLMADMTVTDPDSDFADRAMSIDGVETVMLRRQADVPMASGEFSFLGRVIAHPPAGSEPGLNRIDIDDGVGLDRAEPAGVLLETHAATDFELEVGDEFEIAGQNVVVRGIVTSPEYLWPARDRQNVFTPPKSFAVAFVLDELLDTELSQAGSSEVLVRYVDGSDTDTVDAAVTSAAESAEAADIEKLIDQPSNATIHLEIAGLQTIAWALPLLFLAAAGMAIYVVIARLVFAQRAVIGTLRASGFTSRAMSSHYRGFGLGVGLTGAVVGAVLGSILARVMTAIYTQVFGIPDLVANFHLPTVLMALLFGGVSGFLAAVPPARSVAALPPAEAMRGDAPPTTGKVSIFERLIPPLRRAPVRWLMSLRGIGRNKKRSTSMVAGVVLSMILILASWGMMDTMLVSIDRQFNDIAVEDATVAFGGPVDDAQVAAIATVPGVAAAEPVIGLSATVEHADASYTTLLEGYTAGTQVHGFDPALPPSGTLLGRAMEDLLGVSVGDTVTLRLSDVDTDITASVAGFVSEPLGTMAYMDAETLRAALDAQGVDAETLASPANTTAKTLFHANADASTTVSMLRNVDGVAAVIDSTEIRDLIESFQVLFYAFVGMMLFFGGAMAFALIFNIISVNVSERSAEFASMRANGLTYRQVAALIVGETALLVTIGIAPGLIAGYAAAVAFMNTFSTDQFPIEVTVRWFVFAGASAAMFVAAGLSLLPALRAVKRIDVGQMVRERSN